MSKLLLGAATALALATFGTAHAQTATTTTTTTTRTIEIAPEVRTEVREYVVREARPSVPLPGEVALEVGTRLPDEVEVYSVDIEGQPQFEYDYVVIDERPVLVDPASREIIYIYE